MRTNDQNKRGNAIAAARAEAASVAPGPGRKSALAVGIQLAFLTALLHGADVRAADSSTTGDSAEATDKRSANENGSSAVVPTVTVTAAPTSAPPARGALGTRDDLKTPFSTTTATSDKIEERQVKALGELFVDDAAVASKGNTYTQGAYALSIRGIPMDFTNNYKINGQPFQMYGVELPLEDFQSVDVLKGASAFLYGFGAPGGIVNFVTKKPTEDFTFSFDTGFSSPSLISEHIDVGDTVGPGKNLGFRLNVSHEQGETYTGAFLDRTAVVLSGSAKISQDLTINADFLYQQRNLNGGVPTFNTSLYPVGSALPGPVSGGKDLSSYDGAYYDSTVYVFTTDAHYRINDTWSAEVDYGHTIKKIDSAYETIYLTSPAGAYSDRLNPYYAPTLTYDNVQASAEGKFKTGPFSHDLVFGVNYQTLRRELNTNSSLSIYGSYSAGNLYQDPASLLMPQGIDRSDFYTISRWNTTSLFASDTIDFTRYWSLLAGVRYIDYHNRNYATTGAQTANYVQHPVTPTFALMFKPRSDTTLYASYIQALEDGGTVATTYANANQALPAIRSKQYEIGAKVDREQWGAAAAVFQTDRGAGYADYTTNTLGIYRNDGESRYRGIDANVHYDLTRDLTASLSATWLNAEYRRAAVAIVGNRVEGVPDFSGAVALSERVRWVPGLTLHADVAYTGPEEVNSANNWLLPSFTLFNLGASYVTRIAHKDVTFRAELDNVLGHKYWYSSSSGNGASNSIQLGAPRVISLNARIDL